MLRRRLAAGPREDRALITVMLACALIFVAQWPRLARDAALAPDRPLDMLLGGALLAWLFIAPLALYVLAALARVAARLFGGQGTWFSARMALFWALLAASPLWLLSGLIAGLAGPGAVLGGVGLAAITAFAAFWAAGIWETERKDGSRA